jgi:putative hydrolase of the HAD superfamily
MPPQRILTLDAAQTLVRTSFDPGTFVSDCAEGCGLTVTEDQRNLFRKTFRRQWPRYRQINETRSPQDGDLFWQELITEWLAAIGHDPQTTPQLVEVGQSLLYGPQSPYFELYEDTLPALSRLKNLNVRMGVVSNWDYSLVRVLKALGILDYFEFALASLEEGVEKPEPGLFNIALDRLQTKPEEVVHVGDNPLDDIEGARGVGMYALLINRELTESDQNQIHTLMKIPEVMGWVD